MSDNSEVKDAVAEVQSREDRGPKSNWCTDAHFPGEPDISVLTELAGREPDISELEDADQPNAGWYCEWWCRNEAEAKNIWKAIADAGIPLDAVNCDDHASA